MRRPIRPAASLSGLSDELLATAAFLPALGPFPPTLWSVVAQLPVLDVNGALLAALDTMERPAAIAAVFACDPFLRPSDAAAALRRGGVTRVLNWPSVQAHEGESAAALAAVGYRAEAEFRTLLAFAAKGLQPLAFAATREAVDAALALGLRTLVLPTGEAWSALAGHVAVEGGEAIPWSDEPLHPPAPGDRPATGPAQSARPRRRMRL